MAESKPESVSSGGEAMFGCPPLAGATVGHMDACSPVVAKNDISKIVSKVRQKEHMLPNGCVKHGLDDNGLVRLAKGAEKTEVLLHDSSTECDSVAGAGQVGSIAGRSSDGNTASTHINSHDDHDSKGHTSHGLSAENEITDCLAKVHILDSGGGSGTELGNTCDAVSNDIYGGIEYVVYESELQMPDIMRLITKDLSEPYSIYTYRYFIHNWPKLCFLAMDSGRCVGAIVCKLDMHKKMVRRGYIAMLAVDQGYRRRGIGSHLVMKAIRAMVADDCDEVVLETEITNRAALQLYENLGFVRDKRLFRYYLNGVDALRLKLWLR